jgi:pseudooxynicotine dehydrogenase
MRADYDVIIIGGGFAGVTTAREVRKAGLQCVVLDARDRLGGRTWYSELAGHAVELGGTWIHWIQPHIWAEVTRYGLAVVESPGLAAPGHCVWLTGGQRKTGSPEELFGLLAEGAARFCAEVEHVLPRPYEPLFTEGVAELDRLSVQDRLNSLGLSDEQRDVLSGLWASACHAPCAEGGLMTMFRWWALGQRDFALMMDAVARYKLHDGTKSLLEAMIADGQPEVRLSTPVSRVEQEAEQVLVTTHGGESLSAQAAVIAIPLNVLAAIAFAPPLSAGKQAAAWERQASRGLKVLALVRGVPHDFFGIAPDSHPLTFLGSEREEPEGVVMVGFGPDAQAFDVNDRQAVQQVIRQFLPEAEVVAVKGHDWASDPLAGGTRSIFRPLQLTRYLRELQRPEGRLFFAGSDVANGWNGFIDGAIETGLQVGREVVQLVRSSTP